MPIFFLNIKRGKNVLGTQLNTNLTFETMSGKNFNMVKSKKGRTIKAPARLIAADDEEQVLTIAEMEEDLDRTEDVEVSGGSSCEEDEMNDDMLYHKEVY